MSKQTQSSKIGETFLEIPVHGADFIKAQFFPDEILTVQELRIQGFKFIVVVTASAWHDKSSNTATLKDRLSSDFTAACQNNGSRIVRVDSEIYTRSIYLFTDTLDWLMVMYLAEYQFFESIAYICEI